MYGNNVYYLGGDLSELSFWTNSGEQFEGSDSLSSAAGRVITGRIFSSSILSKAIDEANFGATDIFMRPMDFKFGESYLQMSYEPQKEESSSEKTMANNKQFVIKPTSEDIATFKSMVSWDALEDDNLSELDIFSREIYDSKGPAYLLCLANTVYIHDPSNNLLCSAILNVLSDYKYDDFGDTLVTMCTLMLFTGDEMVWEYAANAISVWKSKDFLPCLQAIDNKEGFSYLLKGIVRQAISIINNEG